MLSSLTDQELLACIAKKNEAALTVLHFRYYAVLYASACKRIPDEVVVEELVQDVLINLWEKAPVLEANSNVKAYLFATLRNKVLHELRSRMIREKYTELLYHEKQKIQEPNAEELLHAKELEQRVESIIDNLSPQCKKAFTLSRFKHLPYKSIAQRMNISVNTVEKHIGKALAILRKKLIDNAI